MGNFVRVDSGALAASATIWNAQQKSERLGRSTAVASDVALDDIVARLKKHAGAKPHRESLETMAQGAAPQLRKPNAPSLTSGEHDSSAMAGMAFRSPGLRLEGAAALAYWVAKIQKVVSETSDQQLVDSMERFKQTNAIQRASFEKQAEEAQKKEEAAAAVAKVMGCVGKILGGLLVAASVVSAVFSGGSSLVLAGVGLALMAADGIAEAATGESLSGRLIAPLVDAVFKPLVEMFAGVISDVLQKFGVSEDISRMVGAVLGAILAVMAVIALAFVAKSSAASNAVGKITGPLTRSVTKALPQMLKSMGAKSAAFLTSVASRATQGANAVSKLAGSSAQKLLSKVGVGAINPKLVSLYLQAGAVGAGTLRGAGEAGTSAWLGINEKQLSEIQAELVKLLTSMPQLEQIMETGVGEWKKQQSRLVGLQASASDAMEVDQQTNAFVLRNARRMAV